MTNEAQPSTDLARAKDDAGKGLSALEKVFLGFFAAIMLLAGFAFCTRFGLDLQVAPAAAAIAFGVGVATLFYTFFPGNEANIAVKGIKLTGAAALFGVVAYFGNEALERQFATRVTRASPVVLAERSQYEPPSGGTIRLEEVAASRGELERLRKQPESVFRNLLTHAHAPLPPKPLSATTQNEWRAWLGSLSPQTRGRVVGIPFARLQITSSDGVTEHRTLFKSDTIQILKQRKTVETQVCIARIFNVVEQEADEDDAVVLLPGRCNSG